MRGNTGETGPLNDVVAWRDGHIVAIDQTVLPHELRVLHITTVDELVDRDNVPVPPGDHVVQRVGLPRITSHNVEPTPRSSRLSGGGTED